MKNNTLTIIKKEFARFFGDRQLLFTTVIMPGLMIYLVYSLMGNGINKMITEGANEAVTMQVENMPASLAPILRLPGRGRGEEPANAPPWGAPLSGWGLWKTSRSAPLGQIEVRRRFGTHPYLSLLGTV